MLEFYRPVIVRQSPVASIVKDRKLWSTACKQDSGSAMAALSCRAMNSKKVWDFPCHVDRFFFFFSAADYYDHYCHMLQHSVRTNSLLSGMTVHAQLIKNGARLQSYIGNKLLDMYWKCGTSEDACQVFDQMPEKDTVSWTTMIAGYFKSGNTATALSLFRRMPCRDQISWNAAISGHASCHGMESGALKLFSEMQKQGCFRPDGFTFGGVLKACAGIGDQLLASQVHSMVVKSGVDASYLVRNAMIDMYAKSRSMDLARQLFAEMSEADEVTWTVLMVGYLKCGDLENAVSLFSAMPYKYAVSWNAMIAGYEQHGRNQDALQLFAEMRRQGLRMDSFTYSNALSVCGNLENISCGQQIHSLVIKEGLESVLTVSNALVSLYSKCGAMDSAVAVFGRLTKKDVVSWNAIVTGYISKGRMGDAMQLFEKMPERSSLSWTSVIAGYAQYGEGELSVKLFSRMRLGPMKPDHFTFSGVLSSCAILSSLDLGKQIHALLVQYGFKNSVSATNALLTMYTRCGLLEDACMVFESMPYLDLVSWNAMIGAFSQHGQGKKALELFEELLGTGVRPDRITMLSVLAACRHAGLIEQGREYFGRMKEDYGIYPDADHYSRMIDLFGRTGCLDDAEKLVKCMPFEPTTNVWEALLGACSNNGDMRLGIYAAEHLLKLEPEHEASYVLLFNMFSKAHRWNDAAAVRRAMRAKGVKKEPGVSWIEVNHRCHVFMADDTKHPQAAEIYAKLDELYVQMRKEGFTADTDCVLHDVDEQQKQQVLCYHSEKLAIAYGLISTPPGTPLQVRENLRMCRDCHRAIKFISKIVHRELKVKDLTCFHTFKDGLCSCGDYW